MENAKTGNASDSVREAFDAIVSNVQALQRQQVTNQARNVRNAISTNVQRKKTGQ